MTQAGPIGRVAPDERDEIRKLYERKSSLQELFRSLAEMPRQQTEQSFLYEKLVDDMTKTVAAFNGWWSKSSAKYNWPSNSGHSWRIDFETCDIYLSENPH